MASRNPIISGIEQMGDMRDPEMFGSTNGIDLLRFPKDAPEIIRSTSEKLEKFGMNRTNISKFVLVNPNGEKTEGYCLRHTMNDWHDGPSLSLFFDLDGNPTGFNFDHIIQPDSYPNSHPDHKILDDNERMIEYGYTGVTSAFLFIPIAENESGTCKMYEFCYLPMDETQPIEILAIMEFGIYKNENGNLKYTVPQRWTTVSMNRVQIIDEEISMPEEYLKAA